jgi:hypothetical protein
VSARFARTWPWPPVISTLDRMASILVITLLALPGGIFMGYSRLIDSRPIRGGYWKYILANYVWCSAVLYASAAILLAVHASFTVWVIALSAANAALVGFCVWMAILVVKRYRDIALLWIFLIPGQIGAMAIALLAWRVAAG